jgi:hypothetical protein
LEQACQWDVRHDAAISGATNKHPIWGIAVANQGEMSIGGGAWL